MEETVHDQGQHQALEVHADGIMLGIWSSLLEAKQGIECQYGIKTERQSLFWEDTLLLDQLDWDINGVNAADGARVRLFIRQPSKVSFSEKQNTIPVLTQLPRSKKFQMLPVELNKTVQEFKVKIGDMEGLSSHTLVVFLKGKILADQQLMSACEDIFFDDAVIEVSSRRNFRLLDYKQKGQMDSGPVSMYFWYDDESHNFNDVRRELETYKEEFNLISLPLNWHFVHQNQRILLEFVSLQKFNFNEDHCCQVKSNTPTEIEMDRWLNVSVKCPKYGRTQATLRAKVFYTDLIGILRHCLRMEQHNIQADIPFNPSTQAYYFLLNNTVVDEDNSFISQGIQQGDEFEIVLGNYSCGLELDLKYRLEL